MVQITNSVFADNYFKFMKAGKTTHIFRNCTFTHEKLENAISAQEQQKLKAGIPKEVSEQMFQDYSVTKSLHFDKALHPILKPASADIRAGKTDQSVWNYMRIDRSRNFWAETNHQDLQFRKVIQHGELIGINNILEEFDMSNETISTSTQFIGCLFVDFPMTMYATEVISLFKSKVYMNNTHFTNIQTRVFESEVATELIIENSRISSIGNHIMYHLEDMPTKMFLNHFKDKLISREDDPRYEKSELTESKNHPNGFIKAAMGHLTINNSTFTDCMSSKGLIVTTDNQQVLIYQTRFQGIIGVQQASLVFAIQNEQGQILIMDSNITDTIAKSSLIGLTFAQIELSGVNIFGNYAELSSNVISMIYSQATIRNSNLNNEFNHLNFSQADLENVEAGVANMNY